MLLVTMGTLAAGLGYLSLKNQPFATREQTVAQPTPSPRITEQTVAQPTPSPRLLGPPRLSEITTSRLTSCPATTAKALRIVPSLR